MNLEQTNGRLQHFYRQYVDEGSTEIPWSSFDGTQYDDEIMERGRNAWLLRTMDEYRSMVGFSELTHIAAEMQAPIDVVACGSRVIRDEVRHVELCTKMMERLGGLKGASPTPNFVRTNPNHHLNVRAMQLAIGSCCIGETISVIMLAGVRDNATDPVAHGVLTQMLRDESFHSRFGWLWLEKMNLEGRDHRWLNTYVPKVFAHIEPAVGQTDGDSPSADHPFGAMDNRERRTRFYSAMDEIVEAFEERGLPGRKWWAQRIEFQH